MDMDWIRLKTSKYCNWGNHRVAILDVLGLNKMPNICGQHFQMCFPKWKVTFVSRGSNWQLISTISGNGLVPSDNKPLPTPTLNKISGAICHHYASLVCGDGVYPLGGTIVQTHTYNLHIWRRNSSLVKCFRAGHFPEGWYIMKTHGIVLFLEAPGIIPYGSHWAICLKARW